MTTYLGKRFPEKAIRIRVIYLKIPRNKFVCGFLLDNDMEIKTQVALLPCCKPTFLTRSTHSIRS
jgi:hypothetical protein